MLLLWMVSQSDRGDIITVSRHCVCSHGEALTFEPLLMGEDSQLSMFSVLAIASVTQVIFVALTPKIEPITSLPLKVRTHFVPHRIACCTTYSCTKFG